MYRVELSLIVGVTRYFPCQVVDPLDALDSAGHDFGRSDRALDELDASLG
jgi:hypothetical protein